MRPEFQSPASCLQVNIYIFEKSKFIKPLYSLCPFVYRIKMKKASKSAQHEQPTFEQVLPEEISEQEETSSDQEQEDVDQEFFFQPLCQSSSSQVMWSMYMPYIEGPAMDWTMNDGLYNRFLKWRFKCEHMFECELDMLPEARKCKKVVAWSGDFGLDKYISWNLSSMDGTMLYRHKLH